MKQSYKSKDQNLFNREEGKESMDKEEMEKDDCSIQKLTSSQIKNAHASGMGALERSNENQIEKKGEIDSEENVY